MRIVGGALARRTIEAPRGSRTRPTTDRVREALFNLLGARLDLGGAVVTDLFAGSGALGLEALSRGAARATFVERHGPTLALARRNAQALGVEDRAAFVRADALKALARGLGPCDLVLADPPYDLPELPDLPALARPALAPGGLLAVEHDARHAFGGAPGWLLSRAYGGTVVSLFEGTGEKG
ncbi:16S rRNA (guanine(966)-N(2))-methyltransferase RsmD [Rubrivirga litoralis]|uniref:16S rRNA (Guanine(966)-N(2))-methyltransferase RsmD n=1 Tax=Rubrivirga litoralis TaxID=3075598 RepID=A0ABU3BS49_9BACT|nr:16S rRNA (guanine(966)-N(2))-methyltransferase RsmD [Rubrivirga sp. F394]MDT0632103.1 16S rRNA (guanine(966)-N(2))-methyltransferase RsmD [Rubrivirga sp. F394]